MISPEIPIATLSVVLPRIPLEMPAENTAGTPFGIPVLPSNFE